MPLPTATTRLAKGLQSYTVFKGVTSLVYAGLWLGWLHRLAADANAPRTKCRDVSPTWRALLYVLAWVSIVGTALYACMLASRCLLECDVEALLVTVACVVIVGVYAYQIQYLEAVAASDRPVGQCATVAPWRRQLVATFAVVFAVFGLLMVGFGVWGEGYFVGLAKAMRKARRIGQAIKK
jgi:hypothetical protein